MENRIYEAYQKFVLGNYTKEEIKPLIERVYLISRTVLEYKENGIGITDKELEEKAICNTAKLFSKNKKGLPIFVEKMAEEKIKNKVDLEFITYFFVKQSI